MSRTGTPTLQSSFWSGSAAPASGSASHQPYRDVNSSGLPSGSSTPSQLDPHLGVTRSRTLLFLSYRDSVPRGGSAKRRRKAPNGLGLGLGTEDDPLGASSKGKGKNEAHPPVYFDLDDEEYSTGGGRHGSRAQYGEDDEEGEADNLLGDDGRRGSSSRRRNRSAALDPPSLPPQWVDVSEQIDMVLASLMPQMSSLDRMQAKHLLPGFVDRTAEERDIAKLQGEITRELTRCSKLIAGLVQDLKRKTTATQRRDKKSGAVITVPPAMGKEEATLARNVQTALAQRVQAVSGQFRKKQSNYMQRLKGQDVRHREVMGELGLGPKHQQQQQSFQTSQQRSAAGGAGGEELAAREDLELSRAHLQSQQGQQQQQQQQQLLIEETTQHGGDEDIARRHDEVSRIASSIVELSQLFQDLQTLVIDQGSLVDRIDYNIETMAKDMEAANEELAVATRTQRRTGRGQCILFLVLLCALLVTVIVVKPFWRFFFSSSGGAGNPSPAAGR